MSSLSQAASSVEKRTNARYWIVVMLFIVTSFNYGDRATLSIAGSEMAKDIGLDPVGMGYVFSAFSWAYVIGQIPGGWLLDRFGSKRVYFWSIFIWSMFTLLQGFVDIFSGFGIIVALFTLRFLVGLAEAPSFPGNSRIVAAWFPAQERGTAVSIFNSAQYFATVIFAPIMGWLTHEVGWSHVFFFMGGLGIVISFIWLKVIHEPNQHPGVNQKELEYIAAGGALINMDQQNTKVKVPFSVKWGQIKQLLGSRMMIGVYIGQYCINALTYFFITWFPVYLVQARGMSILKAGFVASVPAVCGFIGGVLGGIISDWLMRRTGSLNISFNAQRFDFLRRRSPELLCPALDFHAVHGFLFEYVQQNCADDDQTGHRISYERRGERTVKLNQRKVESLPDYHEDDRAENGTYDRRKAARRAGPADVYAGDRIQLHPVPARKRQRRIGRRPEKRRHAGEQTADRIRNDFIFIDVDS